mmetsp:Transcript_345/g.734  ORF Transcript_345/g.734 Transcript_345/m.734 type:complete len:292 (-) Transcript_345:382-1257(-)
MSVVFIRLRLWKRDTNGCVTCGSGIRLSTFQCWIEMTTLWLLCYMHRNYSWNSLLGYFVGLLFGTIPLLEAPGPRQETLTRLFPLWGAYRMVNYHTRTLHECITSRRAYKLPSLLFQSLGHGLAFCRLTRALFERPIVIRIEALAPAVKNRLVIYKCPEKCIEGRLRVPCFLLHFQKTLGIINDGFQLASMANHRFTRITLGVQNSFQIVRRHFGNLVRIKIVKRFTIGLSFAQDCLPRQARLASLQAYLFKKCLIATLFEGPFLSHVLVIICITLGEHVIPRHLGGFSVR